MDDAASASASAAHRQAVNANAAPNNNAPKVQQPKPQALPSRSGPSSILVSPRQKGNPILNSVRTVAWEYSDIPADYVLGATTCALFLSLKYHRLHPEYIYNRIRDLKGQYKLRILLAMVDIDNHEEAIRELSKTSLVNNVTIMLAWSAQEAGRYLELYKSLEFTAPTSIKAQQSSRYADKFVEFITVPRSINKTDALGLVSNFGSVRTAINASPEEVGLIAGWGEKKVQRWCSAVREPFRIRQAAKRGGPSQREPVPDTTASGLGREAGSLAGDDFLELEDDDEFRNIAHQSLDDAGPLAMEMAHTAPPIAASDADKRPTHRIAEDTGLLQASDGIEGQAAGSVSAKKRKPEDEGISEGIMAALNKLRKQ